MFSRAFAIRGPAACALSLVCSHVYAQSPPATPAQAGLYFGVLGGVGGASAASLTQTGVAFRSAGPLAVNAAGEGGADGSGLFGVQAGYEWLRWSVGGDEGKWGARPAVEVEGYFGRNTARGTLVNPQDVIPGHAFDVTLPMRNRVVVVSSVWMLRTPVPDRIRPYVAIGVGRARVSVKEADSAQVVPAEPGINHFNSDPDERDSTLAVRAKGGVAIALAPRFALTAEYRYLRVSSTAYTFGSTVYPAHSQTSPWDVRLGAIGHHTIVAGLRWYF